MTPQTASSLSNILKEVWTTDALKTQWNDWYIPFQKARELEIQGAVDDMKRDVERQFFYGNHMSPQYGIKYQTFPVTITPNAVAAQRRRVALLEQEVARAKRRGKPSYRQRQANARKAKMNRA